MANAQPTTVVSLAGNTDHIVIDNQAYRRTNRIRWVGPLGFSGGPDTLEQCYACLGTGPDVWLPVTRCYPHSDPWPA